jgi:hypothetical protein
LPGRKSVEGAGSSCYVELAGETGARHDTFGIVW